jgi:hypothetical protein
MERKMLLPDVFRKFKVTFNEGEKVESLEEKVQEGAKDILVFQAVSIHLRFTERAVEISLVEANRIL